MEQYVLIKTYEDSHVGTTTSPPMSLSDVYHEVGIYLSALKSGHITSLEIRALND